LSKFPKNGTVNALIDKSEVKVLVKLLQLGE